MGDTTDIKQPEVIATLPEAAKAVTNPNIAGEAAAAGSGSIDESLLGIIADLETRASDRDTPADAQNAALQILANLRAQVTASVQQVAAKAVESGALTREQALKYLEPEKIQAAAQSEAPAANKETIPENTPVLASQPADLPDGQPVTPGRTPATNPDAIAAKLAEGRKPGARSVA